MHLDHDHDETVHTHTHTHADGVTHTHPHTHDHCHEHTHDHDHGHEHTHAQHSPEEALALLAYMVQHNRHHAEELHELAHDLGDSEAAQLIHDAVVDFEVGNKKLAEALVVLKGE